MFCFGRIRHHIVGKKVTMMQNSRWQLQLSKEQLPPKECDDALARSNCFPEDIRVQAIIVLKLSLGNVERQVLATHLVDAADNTAR